MRIAPGIHRIGGNSMINAYLVEQAGEMIMIDAGVPGHYKDIDRSWLRWAGRPPTSVRCPSPTGIPTTSASPSDSAANGTFLCRSTKPTRLRARLHVTRSATLVARRASTRHL